MHERLLWGTASSHSINQIWAQAANDEYKEQKSRSGGNESAVSFSNDGRLEHKGRNDCE